MIKCRTPKQTSNTEISGESKNTKRRESPESLQEKHYVTYYIQSSFFSCYISFTSEFSIKTAQTYSKSLKRREWIPKIHSEHVLSHFPKL